MGIQGLLPALKSIMIPIHVKELAGSYVAVDTYSWLHKGAFSCSKELCLGQPTRRHIDYCMHRVNLLRHHGVKPILIFDGGILPMKAEQEAKRARVRKENLERAIEHESCGNHAAAYECYQKAVDISPSIAFQLIKVLRQENVEYIVAPYEADAQMAFLSIRKHVAAVITEDSDLIPFGCLRIIFKMDKFGNGVEFQYAELARNKDLNFTSFTKQMVLEMCILSGCDYLQSLQGMGIKKAHGLIRRFKSYEKIVKHLRYSGVSVPPMYEETFRKALLTFHHQRVYDPVLEDIVHLTEPLCNLDCDLDFSGPPMCQDLARAIATGEIDPITKEPFQETTLLLKGMQGNNYNVNRVQRESQKRVLELPAQKNVLTNYFCLTSVEAKRQFRAPRISPGLQDQREDLLSSAEQNELHAARPPDFKGKFQESVVTLKSSMSGSVECTPAFDKSFSSGGLENNSEGGRHVVIGDGHWGISGQDGDIVSENHCFDTFNFSASTDSDVTFQGIGSRKSLGFSKKMIGCKATTDIPTEKTRVMKKHGIVRSSYFSSKTSENADLDNAAMRVLPSNENVHNFTWDVEKAENTITGKHSSEQTSDSKYLSIRQQPQEEIGKTNIGKEKGVDDALMTGKRKHIPSFGSDLIGNSMQQEKFSCNLSHLERYSDIAEQSMERFVSVISSFRYTTGGARASGLRPPLKSATTAKSIGDPTVASIVDSDFRKFAYDPSKCKNHPSKQMKFVRRTTTKGKCLDVSKESRR
eukprot:Gb_08129 [translate_table: standard]